MWWKWLKNVKYKSLLFYVCERYSDFYPSLLNKTGATWAERIMYNMQAFLNPLKHALFSTTITQLWKSFIPLTQDLEKKMIKSFAGSSWPRWAESLYLSRGSGGWVYLVFVCLFLIFYDTLLKTCFPLIPFGFYITIS